MEQKLRRELKEGKGREVLEDVDVELGKLRSLLRDQQALLKDSPKAPAAKPAKKVPTNQP